MKVLALSSSKVGNGGYLEDALSYVTDFIGKGAFKVAFIPFASVQKNYEEYGAMVKLAFASTSYIINAVTENNVKQSIENADVIMIGGGNTFKLLHNIYHYDLFDLIDKKVRSGTPYIGWSAGANITGRTISTTNDMPIIEPKSFVSFGFFPFQINPHYVNQPIEGHNGETRDQRLEEFVVLNPGMPVVALPEGTALQLQDNKVHFIGSAEGVLFRCEWNKLPQKANIIKGEDLSVLL